MDRDCARTLNPLGIVDPRHWVRLLAAVILWLPAIIKKNRNQVVLILFGNYQEALDVLKEQVGVSSERSKVQKNPKFREA